MKVNFYQRQPGYSKGSASGHYTNAQIKNRKDVTSPVLQYNRAGATTGFYTNMHLDKKNSNGDL